MTKEGKTFGKRFEKKFVLPENEILNFIQKDGSQEIVPDYFDQKVDYTLIENTYFDSPDLSSYRYSIEKRPQRFKFRIRSYAQDGNRDQLVFLELKFKDEDCTSKKRIVFMREWLPAFMETGHCPMESLYNLNAGKKREKVLKVFKEIHSLIHEKGFKPVLENTYKRYSFKFNNDETIRITVDSNLTFRPLIKFDGSLQEYTNYSYKNGQAILEIKYVDETAISKIFNILNFLKEASGFSKYCFGISMNRAKKPLLFGTAS